MSILTKNQEQHLLMNIKKECKKYQIKLYLGPGKYIRHNGSKCGGYFCPNEKKLAIAKMNTNWALLLLHEYVAPEISYYPVIRLPEKHPTIVGATSS